MTLSRVLRKAGSNFHGCPSRPLSNNRNKYQFLLSTAVSPSGVSIAARAPSQKQRIVHNIPNQSSMCEVAINAANVRRAEDDQATVEIIKTHEHVQNPNIIWKLLRHVQLFDPGLRQGKKKIQCRNDVFHAALHKMFQDFVFSVRRNKRFLDTLSAFKTHFLWEDSGHERVQCGRSSIQETTSDSNFSPLTMKMWNDALSQDSSFHLDAEFLHWRSLLPDHGVSETTSYMSGRDHCWKTQDVAKNTFSIRTQSKTPSSI